MEHYYALEKLDQSTLQTVIGTFTLKLSPDCVSQHVFAVYPDPSTLSLYRDRRTDDFKSIPIRNTAMGLALFRMFRNLGQMYGLFHGVRVALSVTYGIHLRDDRPSLIYLGIGWTPTPRPICTTSSGSNRPTFTAPSSPSTCDVPRPHSAPIPGLSRT